jgi:hypothetical protein
MDDFRIYSQNVHLYDSAIIYRSWLIVPVDWGLGRYTCSCFTPEGQQLCYRKHYETVETAINKAKEFVDPLIDTLKQAKVIYKDYQ